MRLHVGEPAYRYLLSMDDCVPPPFLPFFILRADRLFHSRRAALPLPLPVRPLLSLRSRYLPAFRVRRYSEGRHPRGIPHSSQSKPRSSTFCDHLVFRSCRARGSRGEARRDASIVLSRALAEIASLLAKWDAKRAYLQGIRDDRRRAETARALGAGRNGLRRI